MARAPPGLFAGDSGPSMLPDDGTCMSQPVTARTDLADLLQAFLQERRGGFHASSQLRGLGGLQDMVDRGFPATMRRWVFPEVDETSEGRQCGCRRQAGRCGPSAGKAGS
jgi:hypothetical protein